MPDADWVLYKPMRGRDLPERFEHGGRTYRLEKVLKRDFYAVTGRFAPEAAEGAESETETETDAAADLGGPVLLKVYHTDRLGPIPLGFLGRWLGRREIHYLRRLDGIEGIPRFLGEYGASGLIREYAPGVNLREHGNAGQRPDERFFPRLRAILDEVHARGIAHNDLSKPENILVTPDGAPILIDFQIALEAPFARWPGLGWAGRALARYQQRVDRYHLTKLHRRRRPADFSAEEIAEAKRKGIVLRIHGWIRRPYRAVRHFVMRRFLLRES